MRDERPAILVAEDDAGIRHLIREWLERAGYEVWLARSGTEALASLQSWEYAGLLLDINMPELDGFGVLEASATFRKFPPVLMLTARHTASDVQRALALGAKDYLTKPFKEAQLLARVKRLVRFKGAPSSDVLL